MDKQLAQRSVTPEGPADRPWEQMIEPEMRDTAEFKSDKSSGWNICFSNAGNNNPWRQNGLKTMEAAAKANSDIAKFTVVDAEGNDDKQISDLESLTSGGKCDALIVAPNTTSTLTPAVEKACESDVPVIVFDRGVTTDCPVTFVAPIGGYAFGADAAEFLQEKVKPDGKILALRILPGVDVLETRWSGAKKIFDEAGLNVVGVEFTDGDPAKTKTIVSDYIQREGSLDGVWMDAGATSVAAIEAFEDAGAGRPADHRRGSERLPDQVEGGRPDGGRSDVLQLPVAYGGRRGGQGPQGRRGPEPVGPAAAEDHRGEPGPVRQAGHAAAVLRAVRLRGPAELPEGLAVGL